MSNSRLPLEQLSDPKIASCVRSRVLRKLFVNMVATVAGEEGRLCCGGSCPSWLAAFGLLTYSNDYVGQ